MSKKLRKAHRKFHKLSNEAREELLGVKDKNLSDGLINLAKAMEKLE